MKGVYSLCRGLTVAREEGKEQNVTQSNADGWWRQSEGGDASAGNTVLE